MSGIVDFIELRAEYVSLGLVFLALYASAGTVARLIGTERGRVSDLFFSGTIAFVVSGRLWWLAFESPRSLVDPLVLIQARTGIEPLAGVLGIVGLVAWQTRSHRDELWLALPVVAAGLALATIVYDGACPLRDACYGAPAPAPWGFRMSGLADTRLATPLLEMGVVMFGLAALLRWLPRIGARNAALLLLAWLAITRAAMTPLSVFETDAIGLETFLLLTAAAGLVVLLAVRPRAAFGR